MDIKALSLEQVKAMAYDEGRKLDIARSNLQVLNQRVQELERLEKSKEKPKEKPKKNKEV